MSELQPLMEQRVSPPVQNTGFRSFAPPPSPRIFPAITQVRLVHQEPERQASQAIADARSSRGSQAAQLPWEDNRGNRLTGTFLRDLAPVPFDPAVDVRPYVCFNCRVGSHRRSECTAEPTKDPFCRNCGRRGTVVSKCQRCGPAYKASTMMIARALTSRSEPIILSNAAPLGEEASARSSVDPERAERLIPDKSKKTRRAGRVWKARKVKKLEYEALARGYPTVVERREETRLEHQAASSSSRQIEIDRRCTHLSQTSEQVRVNLPMILEKVVGANWAGLAQLARVADPDNPTELERVRMLRILRLDATLFQAPEVSV